MISLSEWSPGARFHQGRSNECCNMTGCSARTLVAQSFHIDTVADHANQIYLGMSHSDKPRPAIA